MEDLKGTDEPRWKAAEFFAGIGLAGAGLSVAGIEVVWANDISRTKYEMFRGNFEGDAASVYHVGDLGDVKPATIPGDLDIAWASFPCTDLSIAGGRAGLHRGTASSTFWHFIKILSKLGERRPRVIAIENVTAFATSHSGKDLASAIRALNGLGYSVDVLNLDAKHFVAQSRPRLFLVATSLPIDATMQIPKSAARPKWLESVFSDTTLLTHKVAVPELPEAGAHSFSDHVEAMGEDDSRWWESGRQAAFVESLSEMQLERFEGLRDGNELTYRTAYRRMRSGVARWEIRSDAIAGCLRTSSGGSSKQAVVVVGFGEARMRWMTPREYASLMGAPNYRVEGLREHHAYSGFGDAVCAPVVEWLALEYISPLLRGAWAPLAR